MFIKYESTNVDTIFKSDIFHLDYLYIVYNHIINIIYPFYIFFTLY